MFIFISWFQDYFEVPSTLSVVLRHLFFLFAIQESTSTRTDSTVLGIVYGSFTSG